MTTVSKSIKPQAEVLTYVGQADMGLKGKSLEFSPYFVSVIKLPPVKAGCEAQTFIPPERLRPCPSINEPGKAILSLCYFR